MRARVMRKRAVVAALCGSIQGWVVPASAQDLNYDDSRLGQRGMGLAGAYVGIADDASAAYYNPGGLALQPGGSATGSLAVSLFQGYTVDAGYRSSLGTFDLSDDAGPTVPASFAVATRLGKARSDGLSDHAVGVFYGQPNRVDRRFTVDVLDGATGGTSSLNVTREDRWTYYALSYAYRAAPNLGFGITAMFVTRRFRHEEFESLTAFTPPASDPTVELVSSRRSLVELDHRGLAFRLGGAWDIAPSWRLGILIEPPSIALTTTARVLSNAAALAVPGAPDESTLVAGDVDRAHPESPLPWQVRLGASHQLDANTLFSVEAGLFGRQGTGGDAVRFLGDASKVDPSTGIAPPAGVFVAESYRTQYTFQASAGGEFLLARMVPLQFGVRTNLSASPAIPGTTDRYQPDRISGFGASLSIGLRTVSGDLSVGASGDYRWGTGLGASTGPAIVGAPIYERTDVRAWSLLVFVTGTGRAAEAAANEVYDKTLRRLIPAEQASPGEQDAAP